MTAPILRAVAAQLAADGESKGRAIRSNSGEAPDSPPLALQPPRTLVCSGLLPGELDEAAAFFAAAGLDEVERRQDGDWAALLLRRA